ncbi:MAG: leucine-rich repeat domain-containing protein, partial [Oscillospiraceae bacterium]|nr:leucine-rich repeat domain-containing protein [Oscillospiraceae bacterium]
MAIKKLMAALCAAAVLMMAGCAGSVQAPSDTAYDTVTEDIAPDGTDIITETAPPVVSEIIITEETASETAAPGSENAVIGGRSYPITAEELDLSGMMLTNSDIRELSKLTELKSLSISYPDKNGAISDISPVGELKKLEKLDLSGNMIKDISAIGGLTALKTLDLSDNRITDVTALGKLSGLTELDLGNNDITNAYAVGRLGKLTVLHLGGNS